MMRSLWANMDKGGFSPELGEDILRFNGGLFEDTEAIALDADQLDLLINAAEADWSAVEPAIFGTLLERALDEHERARLGAHYTPRAYVERLSAADDRRAAARRLGSGQSRRGRTGRFRRHGRCGHGAAPLSRKSLRDTTILDPACGTGNFLYVALEHLKRLEGEVLDVLANLGEMPTLQGSPGFRSTRTSSSASRRTRAPPRSPSWCCGSAICNGISGSTAMRNRRSRFCAISETSSIATRC